MSSEDNRPRHDHERSDWDLRYVFWGFVLLTVSVALILTVSWWMFKEFDSWAANRQMGMAHATEQERRPPEPLLQVSPQDDWTEMLKRERAILDSYRWVDRSKGIVHIPIDRAMELLEQRGLQTRQTDGAQKK
jgi:hypothetical protein